MATPSGGPATSLPPTLSSPELRSVRPAIARRKVVLPQPDGPTTHRISCGLTASDSWRNATTAPSRKSLVAWRATIAGAASAGIGTFASVEHVLVAKPGATFAGHALLGCGCEILLGPVEHAIGPREEREVQRALRPRVRLMHAAGLAPGKVAGRNPAVMVLQLAVDHEGLLKPGVLVQRS